MSLSHQPLQNAGLDDVLSLVHACVEPLESERVALADCTARVLREDVLAPEDQPAFDRSAVDGFAVRCDDPAAVFHVVDLLRAGDSKPRSLSLGETVRIATGGALPCAGLQVVMKEDTRLENGLCHVVRRSEDTNIRRRGEDAARGTCLARNGTVITPGVAALLASVGHVRPLVTRRPRVLHFATGDEIVSPEVEPQPGQIRDSNSTLVRSFLLSHRAVVTQGRLPEERAEAADLLAAREQEIRAADVLLFSGGASVGEHDHTAHLLEHLGFTLRVSRINLRPGKPLIVATRGRSIAFGLPGNPLAHFAALNVFVRAALARFSGVTSQNTRCTGILTLPVDAGGGSRETLWPAHASISAGRVALALLPWRSSGDITALAVANALARVPSGTHSLAVGSELEFFITGNLQ